MNWPQLNADHAIVTADQMTCLENQILSTGLPEAALMEKVGQSITKWLLNYKNLLEKGVVVLVGPGHNGGDGLVIARELYLAGVSVSLWCPLPLKKPLTIQQYAYAKWLGIKDLNRPPEILNSCLWIDSIFGLGQKRPLPVDLADLFQSRESNLPGKLISIDLPSGICSDTGRPFKTGAAYAIFTLTVGLFKKGLIQDFALPYVGRLVRFDIGIPEKRLLQLGEKVPLRICGSDLSSYRWPSLSPNTSKYQRGRVLIVAGSEKYPGAAHLAIKGSIASGVGSLQAITPKVVADFLPQCAPEVVMAGLLENSSDKSALISPIFQSIRLDRIDCLLIGPGLGIPKENWDDISTKLFEFSGLLILDADALNRVAISKEGWKWLKNRKAATVITPHQKEFQRLFKHLDFSDPLKAAQEAAFISGAGILLKGAHSVFAAPSGQVWQLAETAPWVARTGLGDVLSGFLAGIASIGCANSQNFDWSLFAASALIHAEAARTCPSGSSASEIATFLAGFIQRMNSKKYLEKDT